MIGDQLLYLLGRRFGGKILQRFRATRRKLITRRR
jgi:membrane protein DedA with SNARE-associated domain